MEYTYRIEHDTDAPDPRKEWDNLGTMICFHGRYRLGDSDHGFNSDDYNGWDELEAAIRKRYDGVVIPLYLYDHSGLTISTSPFSCPWDSGQVGFIAISKAKIREEYRCKRITENVILKVLKVLEGEVKTYDQYLTGDVWGYIIEDENGERADSCWGFFGEQDCRDSAEETISWFKQKDKEAA